MLRWRRKQEARPAATHEQVPFEDLVEGLAAAANRAEVLWGWCVEAFHENPARATFGPTHSSLTLVHFALTSGAHRIEAVPLVVGHNDWGLPQRPPDRSAGAEDPLRPYRYFQSVQVYQQDALRHHTVGAEGGRTHRQREPAGLPVARQSAVAPMLFMHPVALPGLLAHDILRWCHQGPRAVEPAARDALAEHEGQPVRLRRHPPEEVDPEGQCDVLEAQVGEPGRPPGFRMTVHLRPEPEPAAVRTAITIPGTGGAPTIARVLRASAFQPLVEGLALPTRVEAVDQLADERLPPERRWLTFRRWTVPEVAADEDRVEALLERPVPWRAEPDPELGAVRLAEEHAEVFRAAFQSVNESPNL